MWDNYNLQVQDANNMYKMQNKEKQVQDVKDLIGVTCGYIALSL